MGLRLGGQSQSQSTDQNVVARIFTTGNGQLLAAVEDVGVELRLDRCVRRDDEVPAAGARAVFVRVGGERGLTLNFIRTSC